MPEALWRWKVSQVQRGVGRQYYLVPDVEMSARDGTILRGDLYLPSNVEEADVEAYANCQDDGTFELKYACVLIRTPYNKQRENPEMRHPALYWVQHRYACFIQDCRGRHRSDGVFYKYTSEAEDGYDTVEWLSSQPWCSGRICTFGVSYLAHVQTSMACLDPPHLAAMFVVKGGFYEALRSGVRSGGCLEARQWMWAIKYSEGNIKDNLPLKWMQSYPFKLGDSPLRQTPDYEKYMFDFVRNDTDSAFWKRPGLNVKEHLATFSRAPVVLLSGWYDIYARCAVDMYLGLVNRDDPGPVRLVMGPWSHMGLEEGAAGMVEFGAQGNLESNIDTTRYSVARQWFDSHINDSIHHRVNPSTPTLPPVLYFRMGGGEGHKTGKKKMYHGGVWLAATAFPPKGTQEIVFLIEGRRLKRKDVETSATIIDAASDPMLAETVLPEVSMQERAHCSASFQFDPRDPLPSLGGNVTPFPGYLFPGAYDQREHPDHHMCLDKDQFLPFSARRDVVVFRTPKLRQDTDVTGSPKVTLFVSSSCIDTDFYCMLVDESPPSDDYPEGFSMNISHGIVRCSLRNDSLSRELLAPGSVYRVEITMYPTSNLFMAGHRIALYVSSSSYPHFDINPNTGFQPIGSVSSVLLVAVNSVWKSPMFPSHMVLPIVPGCISPENEATFIKVCGDGEDQESSESEDETTMHRELSL